MSSTITAAQRRRGCLLASTFLVPVLFAGRFRRARAANAHPSSCRRSRSTRPATRTGPAPSPPPMQASSVAPRRRRSAVAARPARRHPPGGATRRRATAQRPAVRQFNGIVGASTTVITAEDIAHSPAQTVQEIIAQTPGVQLTSLFGGVNGAKTSVDLRGFGAFATSNTLVLINGRRLNDIDMARASISPPFRAIRSSASKSPAATAARCCTATMRSAASSISS